MTRTTTTPAVIPAQRDIDGLAVIGRTRHDLMGIRYRQGEGGAGGVVPPAHSDPGTGAATGGEQPPAGQGQNPAPGQQPAAPATGQGAPGQGERTYTAEETQAYIARLRDEARQNREGRTAAEQTAQQAEAQRNAVLAALGLTANGQQAAPDPGQLQHDLEQRQAQYENTAREALVLRIGTRQDIGADVDRLLDSRSFNAKLAAIRPDDRDGAEALVKEWLVANPSYKVNSTAASSGGSQHGGHQQVTARKSMADAVSSAIKVGG